MIDVPRGKAGRFALHGATLVALEALVLGLSALDRDEAMRTLERLDRIRRRLDDGRRRSDMGHLGQVADGRVLTFR